MLYHLKCLHVCMRKGNSLFKSQFWCQISFPIFSNGSWQGPKPVPEASAVLHISLQTVEVNSFYAFIRCFFFFFFLSYSLCDFVGCWQWFPSPSEELYLSGWSFRGWLLMKLHNIFLRVHLTTQYHSVKEFFRSLNWKAQWRKTAFFKIFLVSRLYPQEIQISMVLQHSARPHSIWKFVLQSSSAVHVHKLGR